MVPQRAAGDRSGHEPRAESSGSDHRTGPGGVDLALTAGEMAAVTGPSGSGKSTIINLIAGIDLPTAGTVTVVGRCLEEMSEEQLAAWRGRTVGIDRHHAHGPGQHPHHRNHRADQGDRHPALPRRPLPPHPPDLHHRGRRTDPCRLGTRDPARLVPPCDTSDQGSESCTG
jgi:energy-coupling factor transporter ATP-binding protein EcfA2